MRKLSAIRVFAVHAALVGITLVVLYPVLWVLKMALEPSQGFSMGLSPIPTEVSLENFRDVVFAEDVRGRLFLRQALNSVVVAVATSAVGVTLSATAAYALSRWRFPGKDRALGAFLVTQMFPGVVMAIPLYILLDVLGLLDAMTGLVLVYSATSVPFSTRSNPTP